MIGQAPVIRRYPVRRRGLNWWVIGCGCLAAAFGGLVLLVVVGAVVLLPQLREVAIESAGLEAQGSTDALFAAAPQAAPVALQDAVRPAAVTVDLGSYGGARTLDPAAVQAEVAVGSDAVTGQQTAVVSFSETALMTLCRQQSDICSGGDPQYQNVRLDLRPGGLIVYADATIPTEYGFTIDQTVGAVLRLDSSGRQFEFAGVDLDGALYEVVPGDLSSTVAQFEQTGNDLLNQVTLDAGGGQLSLQQVQIDDTMLTLVLR